MDTGTIVILGGIVVLLILIGLISSLIRGRKGKPDPMDSVVEVQDPARPGGAPSAGSAGRLASGPIGVPFPGPAGGLAPGPVGAPSSRDADRPGDEQDSRSEDEARAADAEEQEDVARRIADEPGPEQSGRESAADDAVRDGSTGDSAERDERAQHGRHRPRNG